MAFNFLTTQIQRLFVEEMRKLWQWDPKYSGVAKGVFGTYSSLGENIKGRMGDRERGQMAIVVKVGSGNAVPLAADRFQAHVMSYIYLAHVEGSPGFSLEWIRENYVDIQKNGGKFPTAPGVYYIHLCDRDGVPSTTEFFIDPLLTVKDEVPLLIQPNLYQIAQGKFVKGTLRVVRQPGNIRLYEPANYTADPTTGAILISEPFEDDEFLSVEYRYGAPSMGPFCLQEERALTKPLPGVVLAFGREIHAGDKLAVVVGDTRDLTAMEYGGRWEISVDFDVVARDVNTQREILDKTVLYVDAVLRPRLSTMGIEIMPVSLGGESEEAYDDNSDDYYYMGSFSIQVQTDWSIQVPLGATITQIEPGAPEGPVGPTVPPYMQTLAGLSDEEIIDVQFRQKILASLGLRLWGPRDPFYTGRLGKFPYGTGEMIL